VLLLGSSEADILDTVITTANAGNGSNPNRGTGGWNYGIYRGSGAVLLSNTGNSFSLGAAGNGAPTAANINP
jgi:hypothetical protein